MTLNPADNRQQRKQCHATILFFFNTSFITTVFQVSYFTYVNKQTSLTYCTSLYCASQMLPILQVKGLWQLGIITVFQQHLLTLCSVSYFGDSHNVSFWQFTIIIVFAREISHQWSLILLLQKDYDLLKALMMVFFSNEVFLN